MGQVVELHELVCGGFDEEGAHQLCNKLTFTFEYLRDFFVKIRKRPEEDTHSGARKKMIHETNLKSKISCHAPFNLIVNQAYKYVIDIAPCLAQYTWTNTVFSMRRMFQNFVFEIEKLNPKEPKVKKP